MTSSGHRTAAGSRSSGHILDESGFHLFTTAVDHPGDIRLGGPDLFGVEPAWSPDGRTSLSSTSTMSTIPPTALAPCWLNSTPILTDPRLLSKAGGGANALFSTAWSPDGKRIVFLAHGVSGNLDVFVINVDGTGERDITNSPEDEFWPSWSPDGSRIAFPRMSLTTNNQGTVVVVDPDGSHLVVLHGPPVNSNQLKYLVPPRHTTPGVRKEPGPKSRLQRRDRRSSTPRRARPRQSIPADQFGGATWQRLAPSYIAARSGRGHGTDATPRTLPWPIEPKSGCV